MTLGEFTDEENLHDYKQYKIANDFDTYIKQKNKVMKANEAPEKIWVHELAAMELDVKIPYSVEYVRADAFINKALAYLNEKFYFNNLHYAVENNSFNCMEEMFEDFKNYMK